MTGVVIPSGLNCDAKPLYMILFVSRPAIRSLGPQSINHLRCPNKVPRLGPYFLSPLLLPPGENGLGPFPEAESILTRVQLSLLLSSKEVVDIDDPPDLVCELWVVIIPL